MFPKVISAKILRNHMITIQIKPALLAHKTTGVQYICLPVFFIASPPTTTKQIVSSTTKMK